MGQLGNQMFQFAATLGVARYTGVTYSIPNHEEVMVDGLGNKLRLNCLIVLISNRKTLVFSKQIMSLQRKDLILMLLFLVVAEHLIILFMDSFRQKNTSNTVQEN